MSTPAARPPKLRVRTEHRPGWIKWGWWLIGAGVLLAILGGLALWLMQATQVVFANDRARLGREVHFDAKAGQYQLILIRDPTLLIDSVVNQVYCDVQRSDGTTDRVGDEPQVSRGETSVGIQIAPFEATAGPTTVRCFLRYSGGGTVTTFYAVARSHQKAEWAWSAVLIVGVLLVLAGASALGVGYKGRPVVERIAPDTPET